MTKDAPTDPMTPLTEGAASMHEFFMSYVTAGFTRAEAMQFMLVFFAHSLQQSGQATDGS